MKHLEFYILFKNNNYFNFKTRQLQEELCHNCLANLKQAKWNQTYWNKSKRQELHNLQILKYKSEIHLAIEEVLESACEIVNCASDILLDIDNSNYDLMYIDYYGLLIKLQKLKEDYE